MNREVNRLTEGVFDLLIVGGGIYGLFAAWDAALRGLSVALVEKGDFGNATSSNTLRVIHGGLRYLQSGDIRRMRQSIRERTNMMRIAPHLVNPMPFLIPTYGHGMKGKQALTLAVKTHDMVGFDRNRLPDPQKHLPGSWTISRDECIKLFPGIDRQGLTGAAIYYDSQMHSSERLILAVMRSAASAGARLTNHVEVTGLLTQGARVIGVEATDTLTGEGLEIRANVVLNTAGPWVDQVLKHLDGRWLERKVGLSKAFNLVVNRKLTDKYAFGVYSKSGTDDKPSRMFFITPWHRGSLIGTEHLPYDGGAHEFEITEEEIYSFLSDINEAYPPAELSRDDVLSVYGGMLPADGIKRGQVQITKHYTIRDHKRENGIDGLVSVVGVKFTESRHVAEKAVDVVFRKLGNKPPTCVTVGTPLHGGDIERIDEYVEGALLDNESGLSSEMVRHLVSHYGAAYSEVLAYMDKSFQSADISDEKAHVLKAEASHAIHEEMARRLSDVAFRCTTLKLVEVEQKEEYLRKCADFAAGKLAWSESRLNEELSNVGISRSLADAHTMADR